MEKKVTFTTFAISVLLMLGLFLPQEMRAQRGDQSQILQKIIDLPDLQKYYPVSSEGKVKQVTIMQHPVSFPSDLSLSGSDTKVVFMEMSEVNANKISAYFKFRSIEITQNTSKVVGHYFYNYNYYTNKSDIVAITVDLEKSGSDWKIVNAKVKGVE